MLARVRPAWRVLWRSQQLEQDMGDEMRFHIEMEAERLVREEGLDPREARRKAYVRFGGVEKYKEAGRDARGGSGSMRFRPTRGSAFGCSSSTAG